MIRARWLMLALALLVVARVAGAEMPAAPAPELSDAEIDRRLRFLEERLRGSQTHGQIWYWSWMTITGGSTVVMGTLAGLSDNHDDRINYGVQAGVSAIGVADLLLRPLNARHGDGPIRDLPEATRAEKLAKLKAAEDLLRGNAERADERFSWLPHVGNLVINGTAGALIGVFGRKSDGIIAGLSGFAGGELQIWSQPAAPARDWRDYRAMTSGGRDLSGFDVYVAALPEQRGSTLNLRYRW